MSLTIDLNADLGEDESPEGIVRDLAMMEIISSCNIACGGHAGSLENMRRMLVAAKANGVSAGAHPSYPDRENFGRVSMDIAPDDLRGEIMDQVSQLQDAASETRINLTHFKPHGALYNDAQNDARLAAVLVRVAKSAELPMVGMAGSEVEAKAKEEGLGFVAEAFIDRRYDGNRRLVPRSEPDAVIANEEDRLNQGLALAQNQPITDNSGMSISIRAGTLCVHSDSEGALNTAQSIRNRLERAGITIRSPYI